MQNNFPFLISIHFFLPDLASRAQARRKKERERQSEREELIQEKNQPIICREARTAREYYELASRLASFSICLSPLSFSTLARLLQRG